MQIREAREGEAVAVLDVLSRSFQEYIGVLDPPSGVFSETAESLGASIARREVLVCEADGQLVGCAFCTPHETYLYVGRFGVVPEWRSAGVGSRLLEAAERRAREAGYQHARLNVRITLTGLLAYYQRHGYEPVEYLAHDGYPGPTYVQLEKSLA